MIGACSAAVTFPVSSPSAWSEFPKPSAGSLEDLFHRTGLPYAFLDLSRAGHLPGWL